MTEDEILALAREQDPDAHFEEHGGMKWLITSLMPKDMIVSLDTASTIFKPLSWRLEPGEPDGDSLPYRIVGYSDVGRQDPEGV